MTAKQIEKLLYIHWVQTGQFHLTNAYLYRWESDYWFIQRSSGYAYEIEIKVSKSDFFADFKKSERHQILTSGKRPSYRWVWSDEKGKHVKTPSADKEATRPNRFYFAVPEKLIDKKDVPKYAGLIYVSENKVKIVKKAPLLHNGVFSDWRELCTKFYFKWQKCRSTLRNY